MAIAPALVGPLIIGSTAVTAGISVLAARQQNAAMQSAASAQIRQGQAQQQQIQDQSAIERMRHQREADRIRGRLRVAAGEAGVGIGGSYDALIRQADFDEALNLSILDRNTANAMDAARAGLSVDLARIGASAQNPLIAGFMGGLTGLNTGLSIAGASMSHQSLQLQQQQATALGITPT